MKRWLCWVLAGVGVLSLLCSLGLQTNMNHDPQSGWDRSLGPRGESVSTSIPAWLTTSIEFIPSRAGPLESLALHCWLITIDGGPPWLDTRAPPGADREKPWVSCKPPVRPALQTMAEHDSSTKFPLPKAVSEKRGFATGFS